MVDTSSVLYSVEKWALAGLQTGRSWVDFVVFVKRWALLLSFLVRYQNVLCTGKKK